MSAAIEKMNHLLGSEYEVVLAKLPGDSKKTQSELSPSQFQKKETETKLDQKKEKTMDDYIFQLYLGSLSVVGLFVLFRMIQKSR
jgi:hypothetical protein